MQFCLDKHQLKEYQDAIARCSRAASKLPAMGAGRDACIQLTTITDNEPRLRLQARQAGSHGLSLEIAVNSVEPGLALVPATELVALSRQFSGKNQLEVSLDGSRLCYEVGLNAGGSAQIYTPLYREQTPLDALKPEGYFRAIGIADQYMSYLLPKLSLNQTCGRYKFLQVSGAGGYNTLFGSHADGGYVEYVFPGEPCPDYSATFLLEAMRALALREQQAYDVEYNPTGNGALQFTAPGSHIVVLGTNRPIYERRGFLDNLAIAPTGVCTVSHGQLEEVVRFLSWQCEKTSGLLSIIRKGDSLVLDTGLGTLGKGSLDIDLASGELVPIQIDLRALRASVGMLGRPPGKPGELLPVVGVRLSTRELVVGEVTVRSLCLENANLRDCPTRILIMERITTT